MLLNVFGCGSVQEKTRPSAEELKDTSTICGVVREVDDEVLEIQLCGSIFEGREGKCYIEVQNQYDSLNENDEVLVYYTGEMEYEMVGERIEANGIEVSYIESYNNDGSFKAYVNVAGDFTDEKGEVYPSDDPRSGCCFFISPLDEEPEGNFLVYYYNNADDKIEIVFKGKSLGINDEVTVTYDIDTMEILSIIQ